MNYFLCDRERRRARLIGRAKTAALLIGLLVLYGLAGTPP